MTENKIIGQKLFVTDRSFTTLEGVEKVISITPSAIVLNLSDSTLNIYGKGLDVKKLEVEFGKMEILGTIDCIKYIGKKEQSSFMKRIFK